MATSYTFTTTAIDSHTSSDDHASMYARTITPAYEAIGRRKKLTGFLAELHDGQILLHSQEYSTYSQAEQALDALVFELLSDLHEHGLVDDVPAALEAEQVSSTHLPSWQATAATAPSLYALVVAECQAELDERMAEPGICQASECIQFATHDDTYCCYHYSENVTGVPCDCTDDEHEDAMWEMAHGSYDGQTPDQLPTNYEAMRQFSGAMNMSDMESDHVAPIDVEYAPLGWSA